MTTKTYSTARASTNGHEVVRLKASQIRVDPDTQRELRPSWVKYIAENWDADKLGILHVARRGNSYYVVDGQHRLFAARMRGQNTLELECKVHKSITKPDEAKMFIGLNDRKAVQHFDKFRVRLNFDPDAQDIAKIVKSVGLKLATDPRDGTIAATAAMEQVYTGSLVRSADPTPWALSRALRTLTGAWGMSRDAVGANMIRAAGAVHLRYGDSVDQDRFIRHLAGFKGGPVALVGRARIRREMTDGSLWRSAAEVMVDTYNKGLRKDPLPDFAR